MLDTRDARGGCSRRRTIDLIMPSESFWYNQLWKRTSAIAVVCLEKR